MNRIVVVLLFASSCVQEPRDPQDPIDQVLRAAYPDGTTCASFEIDGDVVVVREVHGAGNCAGDPETSPVRDRFRVPASGGVERYDVESDSYVPLE
jgi:hypothetical protein